MSRLRGNENRDQGRRDLLQATNSDSGLAVLEHFGLDPNDYMSFEPCDDVKMCLQWSHVIDQIDDSILQGVLECTSVEDCTEGECRLTDDGPKCDVPGKLYCGFPCLEDDRGVVGDLP